MTIEKRLERLERQNRRLKHGLVGIVLAGLSLLVMAQVAPPKVHDVVLAKKFVLKDSNGKDRARLYNAALGPRLTFYTDRGTTPDSITADLTGGALFLYSPIAGGRAALFADKNGLGLEVSLKGKRIATWPPR